MSCEVCFLGVSEGSFGVFVDVDVVLEEKNKGKIPLDSA